MQRAPRGFTLIEALVTMALLAIVTTIALPSFNSFIASIRARSASFDLINDLTTARSEALKRNTSVTVAATSGDWTKGWTVAAGATTLSTRAALPADLSVTSSGGTTLTFRPNGRLSADTATGNLSWAVSSSKEGVQARCIVITPTGTARSKLGSCS